MGFDAELTLALNSNDGAARDRLLGHVHEDLRRIARAELSRHRRGDTLNTQALVNEAYLKLFGGAAATFENRKHFFATAARAMRQVVIDYARAKLADCRGSGAFAGCHVGISPVCPHACRYGRSRSRQPGKTADRLA